MLRTERPAKIRRLCGSDSVADLRIRSDPAEASHVTSPINGSEEGIIMVSRKRSLKLIMDCFYLPKENGATPQGEDSHFICEEEQVFGVADGVGGWTKKGIDAGKYARDLMLNSEIAVRDGLKGCVNPLNVLKEAYSNTKALGSSTACIVALTDDNCLNFANVGDSGFIVIRGDSIVYRSQRQQRRFNCPFQLGNHVKSDRPSSAYEFKVDVKDGDVIVAGTDGLFDNLFDENIIRVVNEITGYIGKSPYWVARIVAEHARVISKAKFVSTPISFDAEKAGSKHSGGKIDDITVLVAYIVSSSEA